MKPKSGIFVTVDVYGIIASGLMIATNANIAKQSVDAKVCSVICYNGRGDNSKVINAWQVPDIGTAL